MRVLPFHTIPIFLSRALPGELGSQLRMFDVFYKEPPVVGWHVLGDPDPSCGTVGFFVEGGSKPEGSVVGFSVEYAKLPERVTGFSVFEEETCEGQGILGFSVTDDEDASGVAGFSVIEEDIKDPAVVGFIVEENDDNT